MTLRETLTSTFTGRESFENTFFFAISDVGQRREGEGGLSLLGKKKGRARPCVDERTFRER